jgi:hypothetical protein
MSRNAPKSSLPTRPTCTICKANGSKQKKIFAEAYKTPLILLKNFANEIKSCSIEYKL